MHWMWVFMRTRVWACDAIDTVLCVRVHMQHAHAHVHAHVHVTGTLSTHLTHHRTRYHHYVTQHTPSHQHAHDADVTYAHMMMRAPSDAMQEEEEEDVSVRSHGTATVTPTATSTPVHSTPHMLHTQASSYITRLNSAYTHRPPHVSYHDALSHAREHAQQQTHIQSLEHEMHQLRTSHDTHTSSLQTQLTSAHATCDATSTQHEQAMRFIARNKEKMESCKREMEALRRAVKEATGTCTSTSTGPSTGTGTGAGTGTGTSVSTDTRPNIWSLNIHATTTSSSHGTSFARYASADESDEEEEKQGIQAQAQVQTQAQVTKPSFYSITWSGKDAATSSAAALTHVLNETRRSHAALITRMHTELASTSLSASRAHHTHSTQSSYITHLEAHLISTHTSLHALQQARTRLQDEMHATRHAYDRNQQELAEKVMTLTEEVARRDARGNIS